jgi:hypothetical protein
VGHGRDTPRAAALVALGWWAVHQLRYLLAYGAGTGDALHRQGHAYLDPVAPLLGLVLALGFARLLVRATSAPAGRSARVQRLTVLWPACAAAILALYTAQEAAEGLLAAGHPAGLAGIFGHGGWLAVPLAAAAGIAIASALRISKRLEAAQAPAALAALSRALPRPQPALVVPAPYAGVPGAPRARVGACRGPPAICR